MRVAFAMVAFRNYSWLRIGPVSLLQNVPEAKSALFLVNANPCNWHPEYVEDCKRESKLVQDNFGHLRNFLTLSESPKSSLHLRTASHGLALDLAAEQAHKEGYTHLVLLEPDCVFTGDQWLTKLKESITRGNIVAGHETRNYGPLCPCGSIWPLPMFETFASVRKDPLVILEPLYQEHVDVSMLNLSDTGFVATCWDNGQLAWYEALKRGTVEFIGPAPDMVHYYCGSERPPESYTQHAEAGLLQPYL